jgi:PHD/YefM family antitoxin component YafN of YafNO toxin-antitoxin module
MSKQKSNKSLTDARKLSTLVNTGRPAKATNHKNTFVSIFGDQRSMSATLTEMPFIDPNVEHVGVSRLRQLDAKELRKIDKKALVIREHDSPLAVLLSYEQYLIIQNQLRAVMDTMEILSDPAEVQMLVAGLREAQTGQTTTIDDLRRELKKEGNEQ